MGIPYHNKLLLLIMGLSYLHKKNWHPPNMENVKGVWLAERRVED